MTPAQKTSRERFKKAIAEAGKLRKKNPKLSQAQAVKQAWAILYGSSKVSGVKKKTAKKTAPKKAAKKSNYHKDTKSHNVNIKVVSGVKKPTVKKQMKELLQKSKKRLAHGYKLVTGKIRKIGSLPTFDDPIAAREISLYADNDFQLYKQRRIPILKNLYKKFKAGKFDVEKAANLWKYYVDAALQKYNKEFGSKGDKWNKLLSMKDRKLLSIDYANETLKNFEAGEIEF